MDHVHAEFENTHQVHRESEHARRLARSPFGVTGRKDWWGRSKVWNHIFESILPQRKRTEHSVVPLTRTPPRFDETVSVVNSWYHATGFGVLQRMLCIILKHLSHEQLQSFYLLLDSFDRDGVYKHVSAPTNSRNFFLGKHSTKFNRRISRMVDSYSNMLVACEGLEIVMGYDSVEVRLFRNLLSLCVSYLFDFGESSGMSARKEWESAMFDVLEESMSCCL